ncbi:hypothetical protein BD410DRAFT_96843 [Rickenella mellea]|uniref:F-box domain-containing protein n=1 Tax=Rickenella mellea TaxID=50990 RepID=A0A4Y7QBH5_9AGAM|nr:hypothetical protein BD410DRAFT_96843 [Rickenella mellea]
MASTDLSTPWEMLPDEMVLTILDLLAPRDVQALSKINSRTQNLCVPALFRTVSLPTLPALSAFIYAVPTSRRHLIRELDICTKPTADYDSDQNVYEDELAMTDGTSENKDKSSVTKTIIELLTTTPALEKLGLSVAGALEYSIIPVLESLARVKYFDLRNYAREEVTPLSERLAVRLAFCFPSLSSLSLTRIARSAIHAPELHGIYPYVPIVHGDATVPPAPYPICDMLRLPALLRIKTLRKLRIRDTHLGDPLWDDAAWEVGMSDASTIAPLEVLDLGACALESPAFNERCTMRILSNVRSTITSFAVSGGMATGIPSSDVLQVNPLSAVVVPTLRTAGTHLATTARPTNRPSLPLLKTLHLTPLLSPSALAPTLAQPQFALSPVHTLACTFHPDDAADGCAALAEFLDVNRTPRSSSTTADHNKCAEQMRGGAHTYTHSHFSALRTIRVAIASEEKPISPSPRLSARAAARLRAEREAQRVAAVRLRALCKELGLEASIAVAGCDEFEQEVRAVQDKQCGERRVVFAEPVSMETGGCVRDAGSTSTSGRFSGQRSRAKTT